jgi:hypothetical protein
MNVIMIEKKEILEVEKKLLEAMKESNVSVLNELLHDDLLFVLHTGEVITKEMDLETHKSGNLILEDISSTIDSIKQIDETAVVTVTSTIHGRFMKQEFEATFRYIRVWKKAGNKLQIIAGSCVSLPG